MKKILIAIAILAATNNAEAKIVQAHVNGLVCAFCATAIENSLKEEPGVKSTKVDLDTKIVTVDFEDGKEMTDAKLKETLTDSGYTVTKIER